MTETLISIFREVRDPRDINARHPLPSILFIALAATLCGAAAQRAEGGDEVGATLDVLKSLVLKGCIVTADALHCHPRMAAGVRATGAHYALGLKGDHGPLHRAALAAFATADAAGRAPSRAGGDARPLEHRKPPALGARRRLL